MKNLVFDMGNVLIEWNSEKILQAITDDRKLHNLLRKEVFETGLWVQTDEGVKTREEMIEIVTAKIGEEYRNEITQLSRYWYKYVDVYTKVQDRIIELSKNGYNIYILSNTAYTFYDLLKEGYIPAASIAKGIVLSCEEKVLKPNEKIYNILLERYNLDPHDTMFFDDLSENIWGAARCGINGFVVENERELLTYLDKLREEMNWRQLRTLLN
ncbi:Alpha-D-glucose 1-phosphate phosphatase YihX [Granulicatella adiacens]|uniref:HAD family hydrolase n=1 Tax=Granulicatella adiacens TaxID=46124 RepID=UPI001956C4E2|nr:HAD family phosphatase [Granulicatella adiacens]VTX55801.1 Alpha-D-glucose 1-phosphate phosphatase YihX [Granulicatella adiacens]